MSACNELVITPEFVTNIIAVDLADETTFTTADKAKLNGIEAGAQVNTVTRVAGKAGVVELNAGDIGYDGSATYDTGTVGEELTHLNRQISESITPAIEQLAEDLDGKAPVIINTASGEIASFADGADSMPVKSLIANIEPVQDLHGYDYPWPAGGKGNYFNYDAWKSVSIDKGTAVFKNNGVSLTATENDAYTQGGSALYPEQARIPVSEGETITLAWEETSNAAGTVYIFPDGGVSGAVSANNAYYKKVSYTVASGVSYVTLRFGVASAGTTISYKNIQVVRGTTVPTWQPYSNICPISGWTGASVTRTGKNLLDNEHATVYNRYIQYYDTNNANWVESSDSASYCIFVKPNTSYAIKAHGDTTVFRACAISVDPSTIGSNTIHSTNAYSANAGTYKYCVITTGSTETWLVLQLGKTVVESGTGMAMVELGNTYSDYEPYTGNQISVSFPSEAGTVYGGTLDVTNGVLTVTHSIVDMGALTIGYNTANAVFTMVVSNKKPSTLGVIDYYCEIYKCNTPCQSYAGAVSGIQGITLNSNYDALFLVKDTNYTNVEEFKQNVDGYHIVFPLKTPITYQLTAQQLDTILGSNNIWTDVGTVDVTYPCDTRLFIEGKIAEAVANVMNS